MSYSALLWLIANCLSIIVLGFYSMLEMACVSFNKVRLQYYMSKGVKRAFWLHYLTSHSARLFGTTLIMVNIALVVGSECSRQLYAALGLSPELSPLTQVVLVTIFGELAPMFAARRYSENVAFLGVPIVYASARLMTPLLWIVHWISVICSKLTGSKESNNDLYLNQEELQKIFDPPHEENSCSFSSDFSTVSANIFSLRNKDLQHVADPLTKHNTLPANATIGQMEKFIASTGADCVPLYHRELSNIVGIAYPRDLLRLSSTKRLRDHARTPWFVPETINMMDLLKQFRTMNEDIAIILNKDGKAIGLIELDDVLQEIFRKLSSTAIPLPKRHHKQILIDKTLPADTTIGEVISQYHLQIEEDPQMTLEELLIKRLGPHPEKGASIYLPPIEVTIKEVSLRAIKTVSLSTRL